jgi:hypothetical protein
MHLHHPLDNPALDPLNWLVLCRRSLYPFGDQLQVRRFDEYGLAIEVSCQELAYRCLQLVPRTDGFNLYIYVDQKLWGCFPFEQFDPYLCEYF